MSKVGRHFGHLGVKKTMSVSCLSFPIIDDIIKYKSINLLDFRISHLWNGIIT